MTYTCPLDPSHQSDDPVHCSVCGATIPVAAMSLAENLDDRDPAVGKPSEPAAPTTAHAPTVPGTAVPQAAASPEVESADAAQSAGRSAPANEPVRAQFELLVSVDPTLYTDPNPRTPCPVGVPPRRFSLNRPQNLIGRRSERRSTFPEITLGDPGVSHRHAVIIREPDGSLIIMDVGSSNGTQINGQDVAPGVRIPLCDGDEIVIGCWTRIKVRPAAP